MKTPALSLRRIETRSMTDQIYEILRESIVSKAFHPGQRLDLNAVEEQLQVSRTPLSMALARLEAEGLVEVVPRSGTYVTDPSPTEVAESFDVRRVLEMYAVELVAQRASDSDLQRLAAMVRELRRLTDAEDPDAIYPQYLDLDHQLHNRLVELAGSSRLLASHARENVHAQMARIRYRSSECELNVAQEEHERLMAALLRRDPAVARAEIQAHLERAKRSILSDMGIIPD